MIAVDAKKKFGLDGRVHFNVGGSQSIEDSLKVVRNATNGKSLMFAFEGGYHGRTLGASSITSSYRYRRRYGHFGERANFIPFPYHFRGPKGMTKEEYGSHCVQQFARCSRPNTTASGTRKSARANTPRSTSSRSRAPAAT
jgi:4-aminobutyrate aminotransferase-like enzyme